MKRILLLLTLYICFSVNAASAAFSRTITLAPYEKKFFSVEGNGNPLRIRVTSEHAQVFELSSVAPRLVTEIVEIGPFKAATKVTLTARYITPSIVSPSAENEAITIKALKLSSTVNTDSFSLAELQAELRLMNSSITSSKKKLFQEYEILMAEAPVIIANYAASLMFYHLVNNTYFDKASVILRGMNLATDRQVIAHCHLLHQHLRDLNNFTDVDMEMVALLTKLLAERSRRRGRLKQMGSANTMSINDYEAACSNPLNTIAKFRKINRRRIGETNSSLLDDAQILYDFVLLYVKPEPALVKARTLGHLWYFDNRLDKHIQAENVARLAIQALGKPATSESAIEAVNLFNIASTSLMRRGLFAEAQSFLRNALVLTNNMGQSPSAISQQGSINFSNGFMYRELGEFEVAERYFTAALRKFETFENAVPFDFESLSPETCRYDHQFENTKLGKPLVQLGIIAKNRGNMSRALKYHECARQFYSTVSGSYYKLLNELEYAKVKLKLGDKTFALQIIDNIERVHFSRLQDVQRIEMLLTKAEASDQKLSDVVFLHIAKLIGYEDFYVDNILDLDVQDYPRQQLMALNLLININIIRNDIKWVNLFMQKAEQLMQKFQSQTTNPQAWQALKYDLVASFVNYHQTKNIDKNTDANQRIFNVLEEFYSLDIASEKNRFLASYENTALADSLERVRNNWLTAERNLQIHSVDIDDKFKRQADIARDQYLSFVTYPKLSRHSPSNISMSVSDLQKVMGDRDLFLRYFINDKHSFAIIMGKHVFEIRDLPSRFEISNATQNLLSSISNISIADIAADKVLSNLIPLDIITSNKYEKLIIVPDFVLHRLPFSLLNISSRPNSYVPLAKSMKVVRTTSANHYYSDKNSTRNFAKDLPQDGLLMTIFAAPDLNAETPSSDSLSESEITKMRNRRKILSDLPGSAKEAKYLQDLFKKRKLRVGVASKATREFLMNEKSRRSKILHIATHGFFDDDYPELVGLTTSAGSYNEKPQVGFVSLGELLSQPFESSLVVISGCDTMLGKHYEGSGLRSLTRGFIAQGAQSVIGTLWPVDDRATAEFMKLFYSELIAEKGDIASALFRAKRKFAASGKYRHPKYWSGFVLTTLNSRSEKLSGIEFL